MILFSGAADEAVEVLHDVSDRNGFRSLFAFVHGFNTPFDAAARLAASTDEAADFPGVPFLFSWPSRGDMFQYTPDLGAVSSACVPLQTVFETLGEAFSGPHVILMAHSMGSVLGIAMLGGCAGHGNLAWHGNEKIGNLIYAAADVSQIDFGQTFDVQAAAASHITLYASADDLALKLASSWGVNDAVRAGQGGDGVRFLKAGLDTVDATGIVSIGDVVDHGYVFSAPEVIADLDKVLNGDFSPADRKCVQAKMDPQKGQPYWSVIAGCVSN
jgi:esterase/lipase superfamily enzyme